MSVGFLTTHRSTPRDTTTSFPMEKKTQKNEDFLLNGSEGVKKPSPCTLPFVFVCVSVPPFLSVSLYPSLCLGPLPSLLSFTLFTSLCKSPSTVFLLFGGFHQSTTFLLERGHGSPTDSFPVSRVPVLLQVPQVPRSSSRYPTLPTCPDLHPSALRTNGP